MLKLEFNMGCLQLFVYFLAKCCSCIFLLAKMSLCTRFGQFVLYSVLDEDIPILLSSGPCSMLLVQNVILSELLIVRTEEDSIANFVIWCHNVVQRH